MSYIPNELKITINTSIPGFQTIKYTPSMTLKDAKNISSIYFNPLIKLDKFVIEKVPENLRIKEFFNQGLFESLINAHGMVYEKTLKEATNKGYIDNNISVTLDTIFPVNSIIYINAESYVIADIQWRKGDWKVDTKKTATEFEASKINNPFYIKNDIILGEKQLKTLPAELRVGPNYTASAPHIGVTTSYVPTTPISSTATPALTTTVPATPTTTVPATPTTTVSAPASATPAPLTISTLSAPSLPHISTKKQVLSIMPPPSSNNIIPVSDNRVVLLDDDNTPYPDPEIKFNKGKNNPTYFLRNYFKNPNYYNLINTIFLFMNNKLQKFIRQIQINTTTIDVKPTALNLSIQSYNQSVDALKVAYNKGAGNCFFLAVEQGLNYNNFKNPTNKFVTSNGYGINNKIFTQLYLRNQVYDYLMSPRGDLDTKLTSAIPSVDGLNGLFIQGLLERNYVRGSTKLLDEDYIVLLNSVYNSSDYSNFLISKPTTPSTIEDEYENPFRLVNKNNLQKYILSSDYWANEVAITALCDKLKLNIIIIKNENNKIFISYGNLLTTDLNNWDKYLFLYNNNEHYELLVFNYSTKTYNNNSKKISIKISNISLFNRDDIRLPPPLYIFFLLYGSKYIYLENKTQFSFFPDIFKIIDNSFQKIVLENNQNSIAFLEMFNTYFPSNNIEKSIKNIKQLISTPTQPTNIYNPNDTDINSDNNATGGGIHNNYYKSKINKNMNNLTKSDILSQIGYYISIDMELKKGTSLSPEELNNLKCNRKWNSVRKAFANFTGKKYVIPPVYANIIQSQNTLINNNTTIKQHAGKRRSKTYKKNTRG